MGLAFVAATVIAAVLCCPLLHAEFRANSFNDGEQQAPAVAVDAQGNFVVVWGSWTRGAAQPLQAIRGQRYAADGEARAGEFRVDVLPGDWGRKPAIAMKSDGSWIVIWEGGAISQPGRRSIWGRRYAASGRAAASGKELRINQRTLEAEPDGLPLDLAGRPGVAMAEDGSFVVVWQDHGSGSCNRADVMVRGFAPDGTPFADEARVNTDAPRAQVQPVVAREADGRHVVVWLDVHNAGALTESASIRARRLDQRAAPVGRELIVSECQAGWLRDPSVAVLDDGAVVVTWLAFCPEEPSSESQPSLMMRVYNRDGSARTEVLRLTSAPKINEAVVRATPGGGCAVVWSANDGDSDSGLRVRARLFDAFGRVGGAELRVSPRTSENKRFADVAISADGTMVAVWQTSRGNDVQGQRLQLSGEGRPRAAKSMGPTLEQLLRGHVLDLRKRPIGQFRQKAAEAIGGMLTEASSALPALGNALANDADEGVRRAAVTAISKVGTEPERMLRLIRMALDDESPEVREAAVGALLRVQSAGVTRDLVDALDDPSPWVRARAVEVLSAVNAEANCSGFRRMLRREEDELVRARAVTAFGKCGVGTSERALLRLLREDAKPSVRFAAAIGLAWAPRNYPDANRRVGNLSTSLADDASPTVRMAAAVALARLGDYAATARDALIRATGDADATVRRTALRALFAISPSSPETHAAVAAALADPNASVRLTAFEVLRRLGPEGLRSARADLQTAANHTDERFRRNVDLALQWLTDEDCRAEGVAGRVGEEAAEPSGVGAAPP